MIFVFSKSTIDKLNWIDALNECVESNKYGVFTNIIQHNNLMLLLLTLNA